MIKKLKRYVKMMLIKIVIPTIMMIIRKERKSVTDVSSFGLNRDKYVNNNKKRKKKEETKKKKK